MIKRLKIKEPIGITLPFSKIKGKNLNECAIVTYDRGI